jgi:hypothetical protein
MKTREAKATATAKAVELGSMPTLARGAREDGAPGFAVIRAPGFVVIRAMGLVLFGVQELLEALEKLAEVEAVEEGVVDVHGDGHGAGAVVLGHFAEGDKGAAVGA